MEIKEGAIYKLKGMGVYSSLQFHKFLIARINRDGKFYFEDGYLGKKNAIIVTMDSIKSKELELIKLSDNADAFLDKMQLTEQIFIENIKKEIENIIKEN